MHLKIKKKLLNIFKLFNQKKIKELFIILTHFKWKDVPIVLAGRFNRTIPNIEIGNKEKENLIYRYVEIISKYRKKHIEDDIYLWDFGDKQINCNYIQLEGLIEEYLIDQFEETYRHDWKDKKVIDIGGFVGDTALFFLSKQAKKVIIYEPIEKNIQSLVHNLKGYNDKIEWHHAALAAENKPVILFSNVPEGSLGFAKEEGQYQIQCKGITIKTILKQHYPVDVIKVDCEGAEAHLLELSSDELKQVPYWIIETHSQYLHEALTKKFCANDFLITYQKNLNKDVDIFHFKFNTPMQKK